MSTWIVHLRDGTTTQVDADELVLEGAARLCNNHLDTSAAERYVDVLVLAAGVWARIESADAHLTWTPASAPPRIPERF